MILAWRWCVRMGVESREALATCPVVGPPRRVVAGRLWLVFVGWGILLTVKVRGIVGGCISSCGGIVLVLRRDGRGKALGQV